ncbi:LysR substrate-binding domain-containing protein [Jiella mangrovi]|uniref:LysR family transcriptional regulator n=1 Tax=Jiella mangrovi TaxID=2821407 RepID=A0ABS4BEL5_9HYPH|nr:LysR substrate-binding domain-containing protein [Jiella mangrovi]MBP0615198.1 LysR family transcriptional regulator [Jiella mangrovi]
MELRHLRYFVAVAEAASFSRAAERLHTAQPSLSRQIRDLEEDLGVRLFERTSRRVELTGAGAIFLEEARSILDHVTNATVRTREFARTKARTLVLGFVQGMEAEELDRVITALREIGDTDIVLRNLSSPEVIQKIIDREIDLGFVRPSQQASGLNLRTLRSERLILAMRADHALAGRQMVSPEEFATEPMVEVTSDQAPVLAEAIAGYLEPRQVTVPTVSSSGNLAMALSLVASLGCLAIVPEHAVKLFPRNVVAVALPPDAPTIALSLAWHPANSSRTLNSFLKVFLKTRGEG